MKSKRFFALLFVLAVFCLCASACGFDFPFPMGTTAPATTTEAPVTTTEPPVTTTCNHPGSPATTPPPPVTTVPVTTSATIMTTVPPSTTTEPPVTTTEPPVTTTEPPVTTTEPPATTLPPVVTDPITFTGSEKEYDGEALPYSVEGLPAEGIEDVSYTILKDGEEFPGTELVEPGVYTVTAVFTVSEGYQQLEPLTATFTITKITINISQVKWNYTKPFKNDGTVHTVELLEIPDKVNVVYGGTCSASKNGTYTATADLSVTDPYYQLSAPSVTLTLTWKIDNGGWTGDIL